MWASGERGRTPAALEVDIVKYLVHTAPGRQDGAGTRGHSRCSYASQSEETVTASCLLCFKRPFGPEQGENSNFRGGAASGARSWVVS